MPSLPHSAAPKYFRLYESIRSQIRRGDLRPNQQLPTEAELCRSFGISRGTVRKAFDALAAEHLIRREQGRGIFVSAPRTSLGAFSVAEGPLSANQSVAFRKLRLEVVTAPPRIARRLGLKPATPIIHASQLQLLNGQPVLHEERYLAESLCPELPAQDIEATPLHWLLIHKYGIPLVRVQHVIQAARASKAVAALLMLPAGAPVFSIDRLTYTTTGKAKRVRPAVLYLAHCRADHYQFHAEFQSFL